LDQINSELIAGRPLRDISAQHHVSPSALHRHRQSHLPQKLMLARRHRETLSGESLLQEMADLKARLLRGLSQAERANSAAGFVSFAREVRMCLESYFSIADRIAEREFVQAGANGGSLGERIAEARRRCAEARESQAADDKQAAESNLTSLPAASLKPV
jgi:hypothetical protein